MRILGRLKDNVFALEGSEQNCSFLSICAVSLSSGYPKRPSLTLWGAVAIAQFTIMLETN